MGNFYTNITVRASREEIVPLLSSLRREAYVAFIDGFAIVCDRECEGQDLDVMASLTLTISTRLERPALAVLNHDDDVLLFALYMHGSLACEFGISRMRGIEAPKTSKNEFVRRVHDAFGTSPVQAAPSSAIMPWWLRPLLSRLAIIRHEAIAAELGVPAATVGAGFRYVENGDLPKAKKSDFERL